MQSMPYVSIVTLLALIEFMILGASVGRARAKYGIKAPATTGNEFFERHFRVHYNTLEQLIVFLPALWLFAVFVSDLWSAILGAVFIVSRIVYAVGYVADPKKRELGSIAGFAAVTVLVLGALYGAIRSVAG